MNEYTLKNCEQLIANREQVKSVFPWEGGLMNLCCAGVYSSKGVSVDASALQACKELIKHKVSMFSNFKSTVRPAVAAMIDISGSPEQTLENGLKVYDLLKKEFWSSAYLPLAAMMIAQTAACIPL